MSIYVTCENPDCRKSLQVKAELAGKRVRCPGCKQPVQVPALPEPHQPTPAAAAQDKVAALEPTQPHPNDEAVSPPVSPPDRQRARRRHRRARREAGRPLWPFVALGAAAVVLVVCIAAGLLVLWMMPARPARPGPGPVAAVTPPPTEPAPARDGKSAGPAVPGPKAEETPPPRPVAGADEHAGGAGGPKAEPTPLPSPAPPGTAPNPGKAKEPDSKEPGNPDAPEKPNPEKPAGPQPPAAANPPPEPAAPATTWGEMVHELKGHTKQVTALAFTPDGRRVLTGSDDRTMRLWDLDTGQEVRRIEGGESNFVAIALFHDGRRAASVGNTFGAHGLLLWDLDTGKETKRLEPKEKHLYGTLALSGDGKRLLAGGPDNAYLWDVQAARELLTFKPDLLVSSTVSKTPILAVESKMESRAGFATLDQSVALSANGRQALLGTKRDALVRVFDTTTGKHVRQFGNPGRDLWMSLAFSADGRLALSGSGGELKVNGRPVPIDFGVRLWDVANGKMLHHLKGHTQTVDFLALSGDGKRALSAGLDKVAILWDLETGKELGRLTGPAGDVRGLALSADGGQALTVTPTWSVQLWKLAGAPPNPKDAPGGKADKAPGN